MNTKQSVKIQRRDKEAKILLKEKIPSSDSDRKRQRQNSRKKVKTQENNSKHAYATKLPCQP